MNYLNNVENLVKDICDHCCHKGTEQCNSRMCNIGFVNYVTKNINDNSTYSIDDGESLIPKSDLKYYDEKIIANGIANICRLCKDCKENHNENCVISLIRRSLEYTQLRERMTYPGNVLMYLMNVSKQKTEFADLIKDEYMRIG